MAKRYDKNRIFWLCFYIFFGLFLTTFVWAEELRYPPNPAAKLEQNSEQKNISSTITNPWYTALGKTITYRAMMSVDVLVGGYLYTGNALLTSGIVLASALERSLVYYLYDVAWTSHLYPPTENMTHREIVTRSLWKSISYTGVAAVNVYLLAYLVTGSPLKSAAFVGASSLYKVGILFTNEILWDTYNTSSNAAHSEK